jgi:hypothetical protein
MTTLLNILIFNQFWESLVDGASEDEDEMVRIPAKYTLPRGGAKIASLSVLSSKIEDATAKMRTWRRRKFEKIIGSPGAARAEAEVDEEDSRSSSPDSKDSLRRRSRRLQKWKFTNLESLHTPFHWPHFGHVHIPHPRSLRRSRTTIKHTAPRPSSRARLAGAAPSNLFLSLLSHPIPLQFCIRKTTHPDKHEHTAPPYSPQTQAKTRQHQQHVRHPPQAGRQRVGGPAGRG